MNAPQFTPGPWSAWMRGKTICVLGPKGDHHKPVVAWSGFDSCNLPLTKQRANARLIAAAPELYAKVEIAATIFEEYSRLHLAKGTTDGNAKAKRNMEYALEMRAALAKARGDA